MPTRIDTNILLRAVQPAHPMHAVAVAAPQRLMSQEEPLVITVQNVAEFWNAATRPVKYNNPATGHTSSQCFHSEVANLTNYFARLICLSWRAMKSLSLSFSSTASRVSAWLLPEPNLKICGASAAVFFSGVVFSGIDFSCFNVSQDGQQLREASDLWQIREFPQSVPVAPTERAGFWRRWH